jgi:hypothetical protein
MSARPNSAWRRISSEVRLAAAALSGKLHRQFHPVQGADRNADGFRQARAGSAALALGVRHVKLRFLEGDAKGTASDPASAPAWICCSRSAMICCWMEIWFCSSASRCRAADKSSRLARTFRRAPARRSRRCSGARIRTIAGPARCDGPVCPPFPAAIQTDGGNPGAEPVLRR